MSTPRANIEVLPRSVQFSLALGLAALLLFPVVGSDFYVQMVTRMMIMAIFAMSLDLLQGVTGLVSLGHAAYFGVAGYALAFLTPADTPVSLWWSLPLAVVGAGLVALIIGFFVVRTHGISNAAQQVAMVWREVPVPVIAAVHGVAFGGGLQVALGADMRLVAPGTCMSVMEIKWGLVPDMGGLVLMRELARTDEVRELTFTGRIFSG